VGPTSYSAYYSCLLTNMQKGIWSYYNNRHDQSTMGIDPMNNISIIIRILFAVTIFQQEVHPNKEKQLEEPVQEVAVKYLHRVEVLFQHSSRWKDMIPLSVYQNFRERHIRTLKITFSSMRRYGKQRRS
jgi:hypothetical protein